jgi:F-type H+-transporting ATPase subunit delta
VSIAAMQGASREALSQAWSNIESLLPVSARAGAAPPADEAAHLGGELFAVVGLLDDQVALRRALSDPSIEADRKAALVESVLGSRVGAATLEVLRGVVRSRWSRMRDLADAIEQLAVLASLIAADRAGQADEVEDELFRFARIVESTPTLRAALADRVLPAANKVQLVRTLLDGKVTPTTLALVVQLASSPRGRMPEEALVEYGEVAARRTSRSLAQVTSAVALSDDECARLRSALAAMYGHDVTLQLDVDPNVVGGVVVKIGDEVIDGSIAGRLSDARARLTRTRERA